MQLTTLVLSNIAKHGIMTLSPLSRVAGISCVHCKDWICVAVMLMSPSRAELIAQEDLTSPRHAAFQQP